MDKTLFVLGAGSSKDFCRAFPTGLELIKEVNYHFSTEKKVPQELQNKGEYLSPLMNEICRTIGNHPQKFGLIKNQLWNIQLHYEHKYLRNTAANYLSIDNFISENFKNGRLDHEAVKIIKYAIYYLIKGSEQALSEGVYDLTDSWIKRLANSLKGRVFEEISENLSVVNFNYDRIFIKYFPEFLEVSHAQANILVNKVVHIYDSLGDLDEVSFGTPNDKFEIFKDKFERIKLIDDRSPLQFRLSDANTYKKVYFIGFGYDEINMQLLNLNQFSSANFYGTAYGLSLKEIQDLKRNYSIEAVNSSCKDFVSRMKL